MLSNETRKNLSKHRYSRGTDRPGFLAQQIADHAGNILCFYPLGEIRLRHGATVSLSVHRARHDAVDVNVKFPELVGEDFRQLAGRAFRNGVSCDSGPATVQDRAARNSYDPPEILLDHYRHHGAQREKQRLQVEVELLVPGLLVGLESPARGEAPGGIPRRG